MHPIIQKLTDLDVLVADLNETQRMLEEIRASHGDDANLNDTLEIAETRLEHNRALVAKIKKQMSDI